MLLDTEAETKEKREAAKISYKAVYFYSGAANWQDPVPTYTLLTTLKSMRWNVHKVLADEHCLKGAILLCDHATMRWSKV